MTILLTADKYFQKVKQIIDALQTDQDFLNKRIVDREPKLVIIRATDDKAAERYVKNKIKCSNDLGVKVNELNFEETITQKSLEDLIKVLNDDKTVDGIMVQLPVYKHLDGEKLCNIVAPAKDVDGLTYVNLGKLSSGIIDDTNSYLPCTPLGVINMLEMEGLSKKNIAGKNIVIVGKGKTSGSPMANLFSHLGGTVTWCNSKTIDLESKVRQADIIISCVGKRYLLNAEWFKEGSVVIGVGLNYDDQGKQRLDFEVDDVMEIGKASIVSNRVNCTGSATVTSLALNTFNAYLENNIDVHKIL